MDFCEYGCGKIAEFVLKNGKNCCSKNYLSCPEVRRKNSESKKGKRPIFTNGNPAFLRKLNCQYCGKQFSLCGHHHHERGCKENPNNKHKCLSCGKDIFGASKTCSHVCANQFFKQKQQDARDKSPKVKRNYHTIGIKFHGKECVVCGEKIAVCIHHHDENHNNDDPSNLIPLCMNHHVYWHSGHRYLIEDKIIAYLNNRVISIT